MHRIDGPAAAPGGVFTEGDPVIGTPATVVTDDWLNAVQEEVAGVIEGAGIALAKPSNLQLLAAVQKLIDLACPVGSVLWGYFSTAKPGYLMQQGQELSRAGYPRLYAHALAEGVVVSDATWLAGAFGMFSSGNGTTTFRLPRVGGQVPRLVDMGAGVDPGRALGSLQDDQNKEHFHTLDGRILVEGFAGMTFGGVAEGFRSGVPGTGLSGGNEVRVKTVAWAAMVRY